MSELNPQITTISVGTRKLREVTIYPLAMSDQFKMTDIIVQVMKEFTKFDGKGDVEVVEIAVGVIKTNLTAILNLVLDDTENISFDELTNSQFSDLVTLIFEVNYEGLLGNFQSLKTRVLGLLNPVSAAKAAVAKVTGTRPKPTPKMKRK